MLTLDAALQDAVEEALLDDYSRGDLTGAIRYFGWADGEVPDRPIKLYIEIGDRFAECVQKWLAGKEPKLDATLEPCAELIDRAMAIVEEMIPAEEQQIGERLAEERLVTFPMPAYSVVTAAEDFDLKAARLALLNRKGVPWIGSALNASARDEISKIIQKNCREVGMGDWDALPDQIRSRRRSASRRQGTVLSPASVTEGELRTVLYFHLDGHLHQTRTQRYYWLANGKNRLNIIARQVLSVAQPVTFDELVEAIERRYSFRRQRDRVPPVEMIKAYFNWHPEFVVRGNQISHTKHLNFRKELSDVDQIFVSVLRAAPGEVLHRDAFREACVKQHSMNDNTFATEASYSVVLDKVDGRPGYWTIRGNSPSVRAIKQLTKTTTGAKRVKRSVSKKLIGGKVELTYQLPAGLDSSVAYISKQFRSAREVGRYDVFSEDKPLIKANNRGTQAIVTVDPERGTVWGFAPFVSQVDARIGDYLVAVFDPKRKRVDLSLKREHAPPQNRLRASSS